MLVYSGQLTLLHPGNSQAWTRLPFLALLTRCVIGVSLVGASRGVKEGLMSLALARRESLVLAICIVVLEVGSSAVEASPLSMADDVILAVLLVL